MNSSRASIVRKFSVMERFSSRLSTAWGVFLVLKILVLEKGSKRPTDSNPSAGVIGPE